MENEERKQAMQELRTAVKKSPHTYASIGFAAGGNTAGWVGVVLRGNYPYYQANQLPKNIRVALEQCGFKVPESLVTF